jgi:hypothetical protein
MKLFIKRNRFPDIYIILGSLMWSGVIGLLRFAQNDLQVIVNFGDRCYNSKNVLILGVKSSVEVIPNFQTPGFRLA